MSNSETRAELIQLAGQLRPTLLEQRFSDLERMGLSAGKSYGDMVSGSRLPQIPVDKDGELKDRLDRLIKGARRSYAEKLEDARKALDQARAIEQGWLYEVHVATKLERAQASDGADCKRCARPVACTAVDKMLAGFCSSCYRWWTRAGKPDIVKPITDEQAVLEAMAL